MDQFKQYLLYQKEVAQSTLKVIERFQQHDRHQTHERTSNIEIVKNVLNSAGRPLHVSDIIRMALDFLETIWKKYAGWLRTVTSTIPSEAVVKSVIQQEYYHNFRFFRDTAIYRIIMSKSKKQPADLLSLAA